MNTNTHNALSLMSFGFSMALFMTSLTNCFESIGPAVDNTGHHGSVAQMARADRSLSPNMNT